MQDFFFFAHKSNNKRYRENLYNRS